MTNPAPDRIECPDCKGQGGFDSEIKCGTGGQCFDGMCGGCVDFEQCDRCEGECEIDLVCDECGDDVRGGVCSWCRDNANEREDEV